MKDRVCCNKDALVFSDNIVKRISEVSQQLKSIGVNTFSYKKFFDNSRKYLLISSNPQWNQFHLKNVEGNGAFNEALCQITDPSLKIFLWPSKPADDILKALYDHDIWNGVSFYKKREGYVEGWGFAGKANNEGLQNFLVNNVDLIKQFILFFNSSFKDLRDESNPKYLAEFKYENILETQKTQKSIDDFKKSLHVKRYCYEAHNKTIWLTAREKECLEFLRDGKSIKEIARILNNKKGENLSPRTIETYFQNMRLKVLASSKSEMLNFFNKAEL